MQRRGHADAAQRGPGQWTGTKFDDTITTAAEFPLCSGTVLYCICARQHLGVPPVVLRALQGQGGKMWSGYSYTGISV